MTRSKKKRQWSFGVWQRWELGIVNTAIKWQLRIGRCSITLWKNIYLLET